MSGPHIFLLILGFLTIELSIPPVEAEKYGEWGTVANVAAKEVVKQTEDDAKKPPFPLIPELFWAEGLKKLFGPTHVLMGISVFPNLTDPNGIPLATGPILSGLVVQIVGGRRIDNTTVVLIRVIQAFMFNMAGNVEFLFDESRKVEK